MIEIPIQYCHDEKLKKASPRLCFVFHITIDLNFWLCHGKLEARWQKNWCWFISSSFHPAGTYFTGFTLYICYLHCVFKFACCTFVFFLLLIIRTLVSFVCLLYVCICFFVFLYFVFAVWWQNKSGSDLLAHCAGNLLCNALPRWQQW